MSNHIKLTIPVLAQTQPETQPEDTDTGGMGTAVPDSGVTALLLAGSLTLMTIAVKLSRRFRS